MFLLSYPELIPRIKPPTAHSSYIPRIYGFKINKDSAYYTLREPGSDEDDDGDEDDEESEDNPEMGFPTTNETMIRTMETHRKNPGTPGTSVGGVSTDSGTRRPVGSSHRSGGVGGENEGKDDDDVDEDEDEEDEEDEEEVSGGALQPPSVEGLSLGGATSAGVTTSGRISNNGNSKSNTGSNNKKNHTVKQGWE